MQTGGRVSQGRVIVEGFIDFDYEITLLTVRAVGAERRNRNAFLRADRPRAGRGDYVESWQPQAMSPVALEKSRAIAKAVTESLGGRGLFGVELFVKGDRCGSRSQPASARHRPRHAGSQRFSEFELHARAILGLPVDIACARRAPRPSSTAAPTPRASPSKASPTRCACRAADLRLFGKPESFKKRRMGVAVANGEVPSPPSRLT
jgi:phosphoribosylglycinamide formyltransferase 2